MGLDVVILEVCTKDIREFPEEIRMDFLDAEAKLRAGQKLSLPLTRPMPEIGPQVHELRLKGRAGIYRVIYVIRKKDAIYMVHAFTKQTAKTPGKNIELAKKRIRRL